MRAGDEAGMSDRSQHLIDQYRRIHAEKPYGASSEVMAGFVMREIDRLPEWPATILDYGCGRSRLVDWLAAITGAEARRFDPAIPEFEAPPGPADLVICTDVLEHIPEEDVDGFLAGLRALSERAYFNVSTREAVEVLPSGENANVTVRRPPWWRRRLLAHWPVARRAHSHDPTAATFVTW